MIKLPKIDANIPIVNKVLQPYFNQISTNIKAMEDSKRHQALEEYKKYLENAAAKHVSKAARIQIRINLAALLEQFGYYAATPEPNVLPRNSKLRVFVNNVCRELEDEEREYLHKFSYT